MEEREHIQSNIESEGSRSNKEDKHHELITDVYNLV